MFDSPPTRLHSSWWLPGLAVLVVGIALVSWLVLMPAEPTLMLSLPLGVDRSLIVIAAYRTLDDPLSATTVQTLHEVRLRAGREDRKQDTYDQLLDLTLPLWPLTGSGRE